MAFAIDDNLHGKQPLAASLYGHVWPLNPPVVSHARTQDEDAQRQAVFPIVLVVQSSLRFYPRLEALNKDTHHTTEIPSGSKGVGHLLTTGSNDDIVPVTPFGGKEKRVLKRTAQVNETQILQPNRRESAAVLLWVSGPWARCWWKWSR